MIWFGPAGAPEDFEAKGYKKVEQMPEYLEEIGLNAFEYQCGRGVRVSDRTAQLLKEKCDAKKIRLSLHAPYYISLSGLEEEKRLGSIRYILESAQAAAKMGAQRIIVHAGSCSKISRQEATELARDTLMLAQKTLDENGLSQISICPEVMGKLNQLGTLEEVLELCQVDERFVPCIDFGHLNARTFGTLKDESDYEMVLRKVENVLGNERMRAFHAHFSKIEYTQSGGEKRHLTFEDTEYGPDFEPLAEVICRLGCHPVIICESAGTQGKDACEMSLIYQKIKEKKQ